MNLRFLLPAAVLVIAVTTARAQVPQIVNYQGRVAVGGVNFSGPGAFKFALVNAAGTTTYWSNDGTSTAGSVPTQAVSVTVANGLYSVLLGDTSLANMTVIPPAVFNNADVRLRVWFNDGTNGVQQLTPDQRIAAVGYAVMAGNVPDGAITTAKIASGAVTSTQIATGAVGSVQIASGAVGGSQLANGAAVANLAASGQSGVASGGIIFSATQDAALVAAGYVNMGSMTSVDGWQQRVTTAPPASGRFQVTGVWTGSEMIVWGGWTLAGQVYFNDGSRYNPVSNTWTALPGAGAPAARRGHTAVWTGTEMLVWGGSSASLFGDGARYNPVSNAWSTLIPTGAPAARAFHTAVWTGAEMIIWGGSGTSANLADGARFNPTANGNAGLWTALPGTNAPAARSNHTAVWTGSDMIVWGGADALQLGDGARFNPTANGNAGLWTALPGLNAPSARYYHSAVWTGSQMIIWGGTTNASAFFNDGARYSPVSDSWIALNSAGAPSPRGQQLAVWSGNVMVIWGGLINSTALGNGGKYDPASDTWNTLSAVGAPSPRYGSAFTWSGSEMMLWSGITSVSVYPTTGGRYNPVTDSWTQTATAAPVARTGHSAVWTGTEMLIWGGAANSTYLNDGGRFNPAVNTWAQLQTSGAPSIRRDHVTVWTGTEMIVCAGASSPSTYLNDLGKYAPATNTWNPASPTGTPPTTRTLATAVWSGTEMLVWGGNAGAGALRNDGARYNPTTNAWTAIASTGAPPSARYSHTAVWTGSEMLIWGGNTGGSVTNTGSRYTASSDSWTTLAITGAPPSARSFHTAIWTGTAMIVWGGSTGNVSSGMFGDGSSFNPGGSPAWTALPAPNAPTGRAGHIAVWTGTEMIVWAGFAIPASPVLANDGGRLNVANQTWAPMNISSPPPARYQPSAVWTGNEMIIFGGSGSTFPFGDTWTYSPPRTLVIYQRP